MPPKKKDPHPGFKGAVKQVQKQGKSKKEAQKIIGAGKAKASPAAKKRNPRLKKTGGPKKKGSK
jgi:hypothetical protein